MAECANEAILETERQKEIDHNKMNLFVLICDSSDLKNMEKFM